MLPVTRQQLLEIMPYASSRVDTYIDPLNAAMGEYSINTDPREEMFLAQIAHESGEFRYVHEIASGAAYDTGRLAERLGNTPEKDGDGEYYRGHGLIEITGKTNHEKCAEALGIPFDQIVQYLMTPVGACRSAAWFWSSHGLNELADEGSFLEITKIINGGTNGLDSRRMYWHRAQQAIG